MQDLSVLPPLGLFSAEVVGTSSLAALLEPAKAQEERPPCYVAHPVVLSERSVIVVALVLYLDGVQSSQHDTLLDYTYTVC